MAIQTTIQFPSDKNPKRTKYQNLVTAKKKFCEGKTLKTVVKKAAAAYIANAVKKAGAGAKPGEAKKARSKALVQAKKISNRVLMRGCKISSSITGKKKKGARRK